MAQLDQKTLDALEQDACYINETLLHRAEYVLAAVKAERAVDFDFGATSNKELWEIQFHLEQAIKNMESFVKAKNELYEKVSQLVEHGGG